MEKIQIKCTSCGQKFAVAESYIGRMVECGACDEKFEVEGSAILRKKHYPGEKPVSNAEIYTKSTTGDFARTQDVSFETANYQNVRAEYAQPPRPLKTLMICVGAGFILLFIIIFLLGGREEGILRGLDNAKRFILAGFVAIAGSGLIINGARHKIKGLILSLVLGGSLIAMPFIFPEVIEPTLLNQPITDLSPKNTEDTTTESDQNTFLIQLEDYKKNIGFNKVAEPREKLSNPNSLKALILRESKPKDLDTILPFLQYTFGFTENPVVYSYGREIEGKPVTLVTFVTEAPLEQVFEVTKRFGSPQKMNKVRSSLKVIEVIVNRKALEGQPTELTNDSNNPRYFDANYEELNNIDRDKRLNAARRLQSTEKRGRQADIALALTQLINSNDHELSRQAIDTLYLWTLPEYKTDQFVLNYAKEVVGTDLMHRSVMKYLADKDVSGAEEILARQWSAPKGHLLWENYLVRAKSRGEQAVISTLPNLPQTHFKSAASILSKVGTAKSISAINAILSKASEDDKKYFKAAIDEIKSRQ